MSAMRAVCLDCTGGRLCPKHRAEEDVRVQARMAGAQEAIRLAKELGFKWEEPPARTTRVQAFQRFRPILELLVANPGRWALLREYPSSAAGSAVTALRKQNKIPGRWEYRAAATDGHDKKNGSKLYARYLGPDESKS